MNGETHLQLPVGNIKDGCEEQIKVADQSAYLVSQYLILVCPNEDSRRKIRVILRDDKLERAKKNHNYRPYDFE